MSAGRGSSASLKDGAFPGRGPIKAPSLPNIGERLIADLVFSTHQRSDVLVADDDLVAGAFVIDLSKGHMKIG